ncbi:CoA ester lyase [Devosia sp. BK]|uniref:HpcH/HpaI aldolase/citrate lyase family protein n=1 Tax=unclassified Devosia TaxID=196773 RepID=UPI0007142D28|nr:MULTISPECIES: CoA ester lyase [unclassified Devosia]KQT47160.1 citrate lyase [Devosia sp. Leaf420]MDV3252887.1 CoA ester lyase [Devosia sp. BK]
MMRSLLYVPAHAERFIAKAHERGADAVILDLEDAVPEDAKDRARDGLSETVADVRRGGAEVLVRINSGERLEEDALAAITAGADGLYVPKVRSRDDLVVLDGLLTPAEDRLGRASTRVVALLEDIGAVLDARSIAKGPRLLGLSVGGEDLALSLGAEPTPEVLKLPKLLVHYAAKEHNLMSFGMLRSTADYSDLDGIAAAAREARDHGFDGATCVHPAVVPVLNAEFSPSPAQRAWAERVVAEAEAGEGAFQIDGRMVDAPVIARARSLLARG